MPESSARSAARHPARGERPRDLSRPLPAALSWSVLAGFAAALALATLIVPLPWWIPVAYAGMSIVTFAAYALDKRAAARADARRTPESTLLILGLAAGWPGAVVAQQVLRHKTRKRSFRRAFWGTVVLNVLALAALGWFLAR